MILRWGLIGCGDIARRRVAPALRDLANCELVAVNRADATRAAAFALEFGAEKWYADLSALLADKEITAVYLATPVHLHAAQAIAAAEAGKHVLCEKPLALNVAECDYMLAACRANGVTLGVAYYRRFYPVVARLKELLAAGEIGQPVLAQINAFEWCNPEPGHSRAWLLEKNLSGGGPMFDFGCHRIEVLLNLFGPVRETRGTLRNILFERTVEDTGVAVLQFAAGPCGIITVTHAAYEAQDTLDIFGSRGSLHIANLNAGTLRIKTTNGERTEAHPPHANYHQPLIDDFAQAVLANREPQANGANGRAVATIEAEIYRQL